MRLTLNDQATQQLLTLMKIYGFTNPTHAINRLMTMMFNNTKSHNLANPHEVTCDPNQHAHRSKTKDL
jgi:hypothetical protein